MMHSHIRVHRGVHATESTGDGPGRCLVHVHSYVLPLRLQKTFSCEPDSGLYLHSVTAQRKPESIFLGMGCIIAPKWSRRVPRARGVHPGAEDAHCPGSGREARRAWSALPMHPIRIAKEEDEGAVDTTVMLPNSNRSCFLAHQAHQP